MIAFTQDVFRLDAAHFFHRMVPGDHPAFTVNGKCPVRKEIDDID